MSETKRLSRATKETLKVLLDNGEIPEELEKRLLELESEYSKLTYGKLEISPETVCHVYADYKRQKGGRPKVKDTAE